MNPRKKLTFRGAHEDDDSLVLNVIAGRKTVTADTVEEFEFVTLHVELLDVAPTS